MASPVRDASQVRPAVARTCDASRTTVRLTRRGFVFAALATGCSKPAPAALRVAAAASLKPALADLTAGFATTVTVGASGQLTQQIENGGPFDLFLSADAEYPRRVAVDADVFVYAVGTLVIWAADGSPVDPAAGMAGLTAAKHIAVANPRHAPYGKAAEAAVEAAGVIVRHKFVLGESVEQAAQFAATGAAEVGLLPLSTALALGGRWAKVPAELYPKIEQAGAILPKCADRGLAERFRDHLLGDAGRAVLERHGFGVP